MVYQGVAKVQHYVPQFLLRNFGNGKKSKIHVLDKQTGKSFTTNVRNVAAESRFYDFQLNGRDMTLETELSKIEASAKPIIQSILDLDSLAHLSTPARVELSAFLAVQMTRGKWYREQFRELPLMLEQALLAKEGPNPDLSGVNEYLQVSDDNELAMHTALAVVHAAADFGPHFANKVWILGGTDARHPFQIGDNPIGMQNMINVKHGGNLGLGVRGIEIYFPLSPRRLLALWCPSNISMLEAVAVHNDGAAQVLSAISEKRVLQYRPEHVMNANSIQIRHAERFLFSSDGDFSLALKMIQRQAIYRRGLRSTVG